MILEATGVVRAATDELVVELGCGANPAAPTRLGIDRDAAVARQAAAAGVACLVGDAQRIPLADQCVDVLLARGVLHHVPDLGAVLHEAHRVLAPGGRFVILDAMPMPATDYDQMTRELHAQGLPTEPRNGLDPHEVAQQAAAAGFIHVAQASTGRWTHATPPYTSTTFTSHAVTYTLTTAEASPHPRA
jgi:SAM-dependent methyltransferase